MSIEDREPTLPEDVAAGSNERRQFAGPAGDSALSGRPQSDAVGKPAGRSGEGAIGGATIIIGARICGVAISLLSVAIVARVLVPADYGLVAMVLSVTAFLSVFSDLGLSFVTIQRPEISHEQMSALFWANAVFGVVLGVATAILAPALVWFYGDPRLLTVTLVLASVYPIAALGVQHQALLKRHMKFRRYAIVQVLGTVASAMTGIGLALAGLGYWALVWQSIASATVVTVVAWLSMWWLPGPPRRCDDLRAMLGFGGRLTAHGMIGYLECNLDKLLLGRFGGATALGLYATPYNLMGRVLSLTTHNVGETAIPAMARANADSGSMAVVYRRMFQFSCLLGLPCFLAGVAWTDDVVLTVFGQKWLAATPVLRLLFLGAIPRALWATTGWIYVAGGRPDRMLRWELIIAPCMGMAFVAGAWFGASGMAYAFALANWLALIPAFAYCLRGTTVRALDVVQPIIAPLICGLLACVIAFLAQVMIYPHAGPGAFRLTCRVLVASVAYGTGVALSVPLAREGFRRMGSIAMSCIRSRDACCVSGQ